LKVLRILLTVVALVLGLAVLLVLVAIAPAVQTWAAQRELAGRPDMTGSLGSLSVGFGEVNIEDLHIESRGLVLTLPKLQAKLPITPAVVYRKASVQSLVASGWTLDLSRVRGANDAEAPRDAVLILGSLLRPWNLPCDLALDDVSLEGDVILAGTASTPKRVHLTITGGGMGVGREGTFAVESSGEMAGAAGGTVDIHGNLAVAMDTPRTFRRMRLSGGISGLGSVSLGALSLAATAEIPSGGGEETLKVDVMRGPRQLVTFSTHLPKQRGRLAGTWGLNLGDADVAPFAPDVILPSIAAQGTGTFDADTGFASVHVAGELSGVVGRLGAISQPLERLGNVGLSSRFDVIHAGHSLHVASLALKVAGVRPLAAVATLQPFELDEKTAALGLSDPHGGWLGVSVVGLPFAWLPALGNGVTLVGGDVTGDLVVRFENGIYTASPKGPASAMGVSVLKDGKAIAQGLDLTAPIAASIGAAGWQLRFSPLIVRTSGRTVGRIEAKASLAPGPDQPVEVSGTWTGDLGTMALFPAMPALKGFGTGQASGDFAASITDTTDLQGKLRLVGNDPGDSISTNYHVDFEGGTGVTFALPLKVTTGKITSEFSAEGSWEEAASGDQVDLKLTGPRAALEHLQLLAAPLEIAGDGKVAPTAGERDAVPFWGDWTGKVTVALDRLRVGDTDLFEVGGVLNVDKNAVHLVAGHGGPEGHELTNVVGSLAFDPVAPEPYTLEATSTGFEIEMAPLFKIPHSDEEPVLDGRFSIEPSLAGDGINLADLASRSREVFRITSTVGIVRLLRADVAASLKEGSAPVKDTLGTMGSAMSGVFGVDKSPDFAAKNKLGKTTEAVLDLTNQLAEIGCDQITVVAKRGPDGAIELASIDAEAPDEYIRGKGTLSYAKGVSLMKRPLDLVLEVGVRGRVAELAATAGLAAPARDKKSFTVLNQPVHFGGTPAHIDDSEWQQRLVKAATVAGK
jgi:hypothetical protein